MGSEMCIRDRGNEVDRAPGVPGRELALVGIVLEDLLAFDQWQRRKRVVSGMPRPHVVGIGAVSYTHLTLPTIYSV